jgi:hypothetical protein
MMADLKQATKAAEKALLDSALEKSGGCIFCASDLSPRLTTVSDAWVHRTAQGIVPCARK